MTVFTLMFWKATFERSLSTGAQFALLVLGFGLAAGTGDSQQAQVLNAFATDWLTVAGAFVGGVAVSALKCLAVGAKTGEPGIGSAETLTDSLPGQPTPDQP